MESMTSGKIGHSRDGLWRYKRLNFGTNSASEIFQHTIHQQIHDIPRVITFSNDVVIFGKTPEEHNRALQAVFEKFSADGLTLNKDKCSFDQLSLTFFGFVFSTTGISPDPKKVKAIHNAPSPMSAGAVRSFLGMVNYCAKLTIEKLFHMLVDLSQRWNVDTRKRNVNPLLKCGQSSVYTSICMADPLRYTPIANPWTWY